MLPGRRPVDHHHNLKSRPEFFEQTIAGVKPFEIRRNDRGFEIGDTITLHEWDLEASGGYTGRWTTCDVLSLTDFAQQPGYVVLGLSQPRGPYTRAL